MDKKRKCKPRTLKHRFKEAKKPRPFLSSKHGPKLSQPKASQGIDKEFGKKLRLSYAM